MDSPVLFPTRIGERASASNAHCSMNIFLFTNWNNTKCITGSSRLDEIRGHYKCCCGGSSAATIIWFIYFRPIRRWVENKILLIKSECLPSPFGAQGCRDNYSCL